LIDHRSYTHKQFWKIQAWIIFHIFICTLHLLLYDQLQDSLIAQFVGHRTGIAEVQRPRVRIPFSPKLFSGFNFTTVYIPWIRFYIKLKKHVLKGSLKHANKDSCPGYTCVERGTVGFKCLPQEQNTMCPARVQTRTARSVVEVTNHEATAPMYSLARSKFKVATFLMNAVNIIPEMFVEQRHYTGLKMQCHILSTNNLYPSKLFEWGFEHDEVYLSRSLPFLLAMWFCCCPHLSGQLTFRALGPHITKCSDRHFSRHFPVDRSPSRLEHFPLRFLAAGSLMWFISPCFVIFFEPVRASRERSGENARDLSSRPRGGLRLRDIGFKYLWNRIFALAYIWKASAPENLKYAQQYNIYKFKDSKHRRNHDDKFM